MQTLYFLKNYFTSSQKDLELFLRKQRIRKYQDIATTKIPWWRTPMHYVLVGVLILIRLFAKRKVIVISDKRRKQKGRLSMPVPISGHMMWNPPLRQSSRRAICLWGMPGKSIGRQMELCLVSMA